MSAHKSPSFGNPNPSGLRSPQGRVPVSGSGGRKSAARAEDGRFQPAADLRLSICEVCPPPTVAAHQHADQSPKQGVDP